MKNISSVRSLQIDEDMTQQRRDWMAERLVRIGLVVVVLAALGGLLGSGPLSAATAATSRGSNGWIR